MCLKEITEIFHNLSVGIGTLLAGAGGLVVFTDWSTNRRTKKKFQKVRKIYTRAGLTKTSGGVGFRLLRNRLDGKIHLYDLSIKKHFFISDPNTYRELGFVDGTEIDWINMDTLSPEEQNEYATYAPGEDIVAP